MNRITTLLDENGTRFSAHPTKNKTCCCVDGCYSKACKDFTVRFHSFPKPDIDFVDVRNSTGMLERLCRREVWKRRLRIDKIITENMRVCSLHFKRNDYILPDAPTQKRYLTREAVPSCNLPAANSSHAARGNVKFKTYGRKNLISSPKLKESLPRGNSTAKSETPEVEINLKAACTATSMYKDQMEVRASFADDEVEFEELEIKEEIPDIDIKSEPPDTEMEEEYGVYKNWEGRLLEDEEEMHNLEVKEEPEESEIKFECMDIPALDTNDESLNDSYRSTTPQDALYRSSKDVQVKATQTTDDLKEPRYTYIVRSEKHLRILTGIPSFDVLDTIVDVLKVVSPRLARATGLKVTIADRVVMTLMRLKQAMSYEALSFFFKCSSKTVCRRIVLRTLDSLSGGLKFALRWPARDAETRNIVESSGEHADDFHCIVNRIEIAIRRPKSLSCRIATRSRYKGYHSIKFLTAVTPSGWICFLSKPYGGRTSHRAVFEQSDLMRSLGRKDSLMILKDFPVDDICEANGVRLVKSLFGEHRNEISNRQHYRNRLNVNRSLRRFRILNRKLSPSLSLRTEQIVTVLCAIENLSLPLA